MTTLKNPYLLLECLYRALNGTESGDDPIIQKIEELENLLKVK